jgi:hypothetical protein
MALYHLIYQSKATRAFSDDDLTQLLSKARDFNTQYKVTGLLLYGYGSFLQILEGDDDIVKALYYLRIAADPNHQNLRVLREGFVEKRLFDQWAMAFRPLDNNLFSQMSGYVNPDTESQYGRNLLSPFSTMEALELLSHELNRNTPGDPPPGDASAK